MMAPSTAQDAGTLQKAPGWQSRARGCWGAAAVSGRGFPSVRDASCALALTTAPDLEARLRLRNLCQEARRDVCITGWRATGSG